MKPLMLFAAALVLAGCHYGTRPQHLHVANSPNGAPVAVRVVGETADRVGELFAADSLGVMVRVQALLHIRWERLHGMDIDGAGRGYDVPPGRVPDAEHIRRIASMSRFPQGLRGPLLEEVLRRLAQEAVLHVDASRATLDSIADVAARESARFRDRRVAIADGYRRVGADFPGMGEHWVNPTALLSARVDAARPSFLSYARVNGQPTLLGVGFIATTTADTSPTSLPGWPDFWHEHSGLLSEESRGPRGRGADAAANRAACPAPGSPSCDGGSGTRVWVLHVWTALPNPDGRYADDNWSLPFARAGVAPPASADPDAARAFGLATDSGDEEFLLGLLDDAGFRVSENAERVAGIVTRAQAAAAVTVDRAAARGSIADGELAALAALWREMTTALARALGPDVAALLAPSHPPHRGGHTHADHASPR